MPFIKETLDDVKEPSLAEEGEYDVTIIKADPGETKKGDDMIKVMMRLDGVADVMPVNYWLLGWSSNTPEDQIEMRKLEAKRFCETFNVGEDFEPDELPGQTGRVFVTQEEGDDNRMYNRVRLPKLDD